MSVRVIVAFLLVASVALTEQSYATSVCTNGTNCYCDRVTSDPNRIACEDFEDAAFHDDISGAWYKSPIGDSAFRGGASLWLQRYSTTGNAGEWRQGQPASPLRGFTCGYDTCGPAEWSSGDPWNGNSIASLDIQRAGEVDDEIPSLTLIGDFDTEQQYMAWRIGPGRTTGIHGGFQFSATTELGFTAAMAYSTNILTGTGTGSADFPNQPWKHEEWGVTNTTLFMGNVGNGGAPFSPAVFKKSGLSQSACNALLAQATFSVGNAFCNDAAVEIRSDFDRSEDWPLGQWGCVRGHVQGLGTTNGLLNIWFNDTLIFSMTNANFRDLFADQSLSSVVYNSYYNGNQPGGLPSTNTFNRYIDNVILRNTAPASCASIGFVANSLSVYATTNVTGPLTIPNTTGVVITCDPILTGTGPDYRFKYDCEGDGVYECQEDVNDTGTPGAAQTSAAGGTCNTTICNEPYSVAGTYSATCVLEDYANQTAGVGSPVATHTDSASVVVNGMPSQCPAEPNPAASAILGFKLWDASGGAGADTVLDTSFVDGDTIDISNTPCVAVEAVGNGYLNVAGGPGSVRLTIDGIERPYENQSPFASFGDSGAASFNCDTNIDNVGTHVIVAEPFDGDNWTGERGPVMPLSFETVP